MVNSILRYAKAVAAGLSSFVVTLGAVWSDESISLDELNVLKAALISLLVAAGVALAPKNRP